MDEAKNIAVRTFPIGSFASYGNSTRARPANAITMTRHKTMYESTTRTTITGPVRARRLNRRIQIAATAAKYRTKQKQYGRPVEPFESEVRNTEPHCGDDEDCDNDRRPKLKARTPY